MRAAAALREWRGEGLKLVFTTAWLTSDGALLLAGRLIHMANGFAISVLLLRMFGLSSVGTYAVAGVAVAMLSLLCGAGLQYALPRGALSNEQQNTVAALLGVALIPPVLIATALFGIVMARGSGEWQTIAVFACGGYFFGQVTVLNTLLLLQHRMRWTLVPALAGVVGTAVAAFTATSVIGFALVLLVARCAGNIGVFCRLRYARVSLRVTGQQLFEGLRYSPMDIIALLSEQAGPILLANLLPRADFGLYGLCQQLVTAADTPGWSLVQSHYPELARKPLDDRGALESRVIALSVLATAALAVGGALLGAYVYRLPSFWLMTSLVALCMPARYLNNFYDQVLRAGGHVRAATVLAAIKCGCGLVMFTALVWLAGVWGAVAALVVLSIVAERLYAARARPLLRKDVQACHPS